MKDKELEKAFEQYVDILLPALTPYEAGLYILLLRNSHFKNRSSDIRIGKRTIASSLGSSRGAKTNYAHITKLISGLKNKACLRVGDTDRYGTLYTIFLPKDIPLVKERLSIKHSPVDEDYFTNPLKRKEIFERDDYKCYYCGEKVTDTNATLDHLLPQYKGGTHTKDNLKTSCLTCNSIKSGKTYEEAAPLLLKSIQNRRLNM